MSKTKCANSCKNCGRPPQLAHKTWWLPLLMPVVEKDTELTAVVITPFVKLLRAPKTLNLVSFCANLSFFNELSRLPGYTQWPLTKIKQRTIMFHKWIKTLFLLTKNIIFVIASQSTIFIEAKGRVVCLQTCENFAWEQKHSAVSNLSNLIHKCNVHRVQSKLFTLNVQSNSPTERKEEKNQTLGNPQDWEQSQN